MKYLMTLILFVTILSCTKDETISSSQVQKECDGETAMMIGVDLKELMMNDTIKSVRVSYLNSPVDGNILNVSFYTQPYNGDSPDVRSHVCKLEQSETSIPVGSNIVFNMNGEVEDWIYRISPGIQDIGFNIENYCIASTD